MALQGSKSKLLRIACVISLGLSTLSVVWGMVATATTARVYDVIVVGGGSAGLTAAKFTRTLGNTCLLIESARLGGDCTWTGCVPSKSLIAAARTTFGRTGNDFAQIQKEIAAKIKQIYDKDDSENALHALGIEVMTGRASMLSSNSLQVTPLEGGDPLSIRAKKGIVLCTGASAKNSYIPGCTRYLTYESLWNLETLPKTLIVIGGGPIGCEMAQALSRLGVEVTIAAKDLLPREDKEVGRRLAEIFESEGIAICRGKVIQVVEASDGTSTVTTDLGNRVTASAILVALGRSPRVEGLRLAEVGIEIVNGAISTNQRLQTTLKGVYAAGDCTGDKQFTHYAGYQGAIAVRNILLPLSDIGVLTNEVPATIFTSPEVASVGLTEDTAKTKFGNDMVGVAIKCFSNVDRAVCDGRQEGFIKVVYRKSNLRVLGATIMAPVAGELISEIAVIMNANMGFDQLAKVMHPYPSYAIALQVMAAELYYEKTVKLKWIYDILKKLGL